MAGEYTHDDVLDAALDFITTNGNKQTICSAAPTTYAEATTAPGTGYMLAEVTMTGGDYTGPGDGVVSGRRLTVNTMTGVTIGTTGTVTHRAIVDTVNLKLLYVTSAPSTGVTESTTRTFESWDIEIRDPAVV